ncbi:MAG: ATP-dependent DNA helicase RecG [Synergistaceae bacterium]|nr:ATP-dependent DNA helicase RecG [Synergistaceae bacterium]
MDRTARRTADPSENDILSVPLNSLRGVGPKRAKLLSVLGAATAKDLLWLFPRRYEDRRSVSKISGLVPGRAAAVFAIVDEIERRSLQKPGLELVVCRFHDETGVLSASWFNRKGMEYILKKGTFAALYGVPSLRSGGLEMSNPEFEVLKNEAEGRSFTGIIPIYPSTAGLPVRWFRHFMEDLLDGMIPSVQETLPPFIMKKRNLMPLRDALRAMHRPCSGAEWKEARRRLAYEEFLLVQTGLALRRESLKNGHPSPIILPNGDIYRKFRASIPFELTKSQENALDEIFADTSVNSPMSRMLQGDVGAGKTLVAIGLAAAAADTGVQTALMAPTEALAEQLYSQCVKWLSPLGVSCVMLKGGQSVPVRRAVLGSVSDGKAIVIVGTQALLEGGVGFKNLGVVIIDEQQRFGVMQRAVMLDRYPAPHVLMMSATPIPRTLALCVFGDLDVSVLKEKPKGRFKTETRIIDAKKMRILLRFIADEACAGGHIYWICPRVECDGTPDVASAEDRYSFIARYLGPLGVGLLHGRMDSAEKDAVLNKFRSGEIKILIGTTVVEVGVDVPEATVIVIESPEQFGLSQLHQLRGRVGRGDRRGVCVLLVRSLDGEIPERLAVMLKTDDGFEIAEADLAFRGAGELSGASQHGMTEFKVADPARDMQLLLEAREDAYEWVARDHELSEGRLFMDKLRTDLGGTLGIG